MNVSEIPERGANEKEVYGLLVLLTAEREAGGQTWELFDGENNIWFDSFRLFTSQGQDAQINGLYNRAVIDVNCECDVIKSIQFIDQIM